MAKKEPVKIVMTIEKVCKGSVRYANHDTGGVATNIYVNKTFADPMPDKITVTIEPA